MSTIERSSSAITVGHSLSTDSMDPDAERRWSAWKARGVVQDGVIRQRFVALLVVAGAVIVGAAGIYGLMFS